MQFFEVEQNEGDEPKFFPNLAKAIKQGIKNSTRNGQDEDWLATLINITKHTVGTDKDNILRFLNDEGGTSSSIVDIGHVQGTHWHLDGFKL